MYKTLILISLIAASSAWGQDTTTVNSPTKKRQDNWMTCYLDAAIMGEITCTEVNLKYIAKIIYDSNNIVALFHSDGSRYVLCPKDDLVKGRLCNSSQ